MARYRLSGPAKADIASILTNSEELHGRQARIRYRACIAAALRRVAADPSGRGSVDRTDVMAGTRSFHIRHSRDGSRETPVAAPVHVIFYRVARPGIVDIVRVLHERMEPQWHLGGG